jgi:transposase
VCIDGRAHWNWVFQNDQAVIHVARNSRAAGVVADVLAGHRPSIWVSELYGVQQGHADLWQICLAHQLCDCEFAIEAGDTAFAPLMKILLLRAVVLARWCKILAASTQRSYQRRLDHDLNAIMNSAPTTRHGKQLRKRYGKAHNHLFTFLEHPEVPPDNNGSNGLCGPPPPTARLPAVSAQIGVRIFSPPFDPLWVPQHAEGLEPIRLFELF